MFEKLGKNIDQALRDVSRETGATRTESRTTPVTAAYPEAASPLLKLDMSVGSLALTPGGDQLLDGTVSYNIAEWTPQVVTQGNTVTVRQEVGVHLIGAWNSPHNDWKLALGTARPFALAVSKGAGDAWLALGGVPLTEARLSIGAGKMQIGFDKLNPASCSGFTVSMGAGNLLIDDLLNANSSAFDYSGGAGELTLNVTGETVVRPLTVNLSTGAGRIILNVKRGVPCQILVRKFVGNVRMAGDFQLIGGQNYGSQNYQTAAYATADSPKVTIHVNTPVADIMLNEVS